MEWLFPGSFCVLLTASLALDIFILWALLGGTSSFSPTDSSKAWSAPPWFPWSIACTVPPASLRAPPEALLAPCYLYHIPC